MKLRSGRVAAPSKSPTPAPAKSTKVSKVREAKPPTKKRTSSPKAPVTKAQAKSTPKRTQPLSLQTNALPNPPLHQGPPFRPCSIFKNVSKFEADVARYETGIKDGKDAYGFTVRNWRKRFFARNGEVFSDEGLLTYESPVDPKERWEQRHCSYTESSYPPIKEKEVEKEENGGREAKREEGKEVMWPLNHVLREGEALSVDTSVEDEEEVFEGWSLTEEEVSGTATRKYQAYVETDTEITP